MVDIELDKRRAMRVVVSFEVGGDVPALPHRRKANIESSEVKGRGVG